MIDNEELKAAIEADNGPKYVKHWEKNSIVVRKPFDYTSISLGNGINCDNGCHMNFSDSESDTSKGLCFFALS